MCTQPVVFVCILQTPAGIEPATHNTETCLQINEQFGKTFTQTLKCLHYIYPVCDIYVPWHRHQVELTNSFW